MNRGFRFWFVCLHLQRDQIKKVLLQSEKAREGLKNAKYVAKDGLHPSANQYTAWITKYGVEIAAQIKALE